MGSCCHCADTHSSIAVPLVSKDALSADTDYDFCIPLDPNSKWAGNGYYHLISTLESKLSPLFPPSIIKLIARFSHIGLEPPNNDIAFVTETIVIDAMNRLLIHYSPNIHCESVLDRYDCVESDLITKYGTVIYFEVTFVQFLRRFLKDCSLGISVGFRTGQSSLTNNIGICNGGMLGWSDNTVGIHCDDGKVFCTDFENVYGRPSLESTFSEPDIIGCGYNYETKHIFFTKNGKLIFVDFVDFIENHSFEGIHATVVFFSNATLLKSERFGAMTHEEKECLIEFNFGSKPLKFDIQNYNGETIPKLMSFVKTLL